MGTAPIRTGPRLYRGAAWAGFVASAALYGNELRRIGAQVVAYRTLWEQTNRATIRRLDDKNAPRPHFLLALGDSASQGVGARHWRQGYVPRLAELIATRRGVPVAVMNLSVSGATAESALAVQIPLLERVGFRPDSIALNIGGNDVGVRDLSPRQFRYQVRQLLGRLPGVAQVGNIPSFSFLPVDNRAAELSQILDEEVMQGGHGVVDLRAFSQTLSTPEYLFRYHAADLFHPNSRAYTAWAERFWRELQRAEEMRLPPAQRKE